MKFIFPNGFSEEEKTRCTPIDGNYSTLKLSDLEERGMDVKFLKLLLDNLPPMAFVAGGAVESIFRNEEPKDYDIYFSNESAYQDLICDILDSQDDEDSFWYAYGKDLDDDDFKFKLDEKKRFIDITAKDKPKIQLITTMLYESPEHTLSTFDFTACMGAAQSGGTDFDEDKPDHRVIIHPMMAVDVARKRLVLNRMTFPASTLRRMIKYTHKGYYACPGSIEKIALAVAETLGNNPNATGPVYID